jgi:hypothetical protein
VAEPAARAHIPLTGSVRSTGTRRERGRELRDACPGELAIVNPVSALTTDAAQAELTNYDFFSATWRAVPLLALLPRRVVPRADRAGEPPLSSRPTVFLAHNPPTDRRVGAWAATRRLRPAEPASRSAVSTPAPVPPDPSAQIGGPTQRSSAATSACA